MVLADTTWLPDLELAQGERIFLLREMYWARTHEAAVAVKPIAGSGVNSLLGHAQDFATLLEASDPFIQDHELIVGCCLALPEDEARINRGYYNPHYPPGYALLLEKGLAGLRDEARQRLSSEVDPAKAEFLQAVALSYDAACRYVARYAQHARELALSAPTAQRLAELEGIAAVCDELATGRPSTFQAALQLVQFTRLFGGRGCIGRFDEWSYPFYRRDIEQGRLSQEQAQELLECLFIKLNYFGDASPEQVGGLRKIRDAYAASNDTLRNIALAGQTPDGRDATNELTYMCLDAAVRLRLPEPKLNVHFFDGSPRELLQACCRAMASGVNTVAVYNDEIAIPALLRLGIPLEDARGYCNDGCEELIIGGKSTITFKVHDSLPVLTETVLQAEEHPYTSMGEVMADFEQRLTRFMPDDHGAADPVTFPFFAATILDCLEKASPSGVRYNIWGSILAQVGNSADGLAAIQRLIFDEGALTWPELVLALQANYGGHEPLRQMILHRAPKYGNDDDRVDAIARDIAEHFCDGVLQRAANPPGPGHKRAPGLMCFGIHRKSDLPASPDGRRQGDLTANSFSPSVGMDKQGPTAVLKSVAKVDCTKASHGSVLDLALNAAVVQGEAGLQRLVALVEAFLAMRCTATLQLNIIDRQTLLEARAHPDRPEYRTLIVRVWGFSAVFVELLPGLQDHVLARTAHGSS